MAISCYAAFQPGEQLKPYSHQTGKLGDWEVEIQITHCGLCHSDIHLIDNDWQISTYPLVPGHEIVGIVRQVGAQVTGVKGGDRVGVGWQCGSCLQCEWCIRGEEHCCTQSAATCVGRPGGFAEAIRVDGRFAHPIPAVLSSEEAAPLLCAGITVYSPLRYLGAQPGSRVAILGIGGLGHLAIQYAKAMGCEVTAISTTRDKEKEARTFGAHHFLLSSDKSEMQKAAGSFDFILSTVFAKLDWPLLMNLLRTRGTLCIVGAGADAIQIPSDVLLMGQKGIRGSIIGSRTTMQEMLRFSALHSVRPKIEVVPLSAVNEAIEKVRKNQARYRMVLAV